MSGTRSSNSGALLHNEDWLESYRRQAQSTQRAQHAEGSILDRAKSRLDWIEKELARVDSLKAEAAQLRRMIKAAEDSE